MNKTAKQTARSGKGTDGKFLKGNKYSKGRKKGSKDKFTSLKQSFLDAFQDKRIGGTEGLTTVYSKNDIRKMEFFKLITKLFPTSIVGGDEKDSEPIRIIYTPIKKEKKEEKKEEAKEIEA